MLHDGVEAEVYRPRPSAGDAFTRAAFAPALTGLSAVLAGFPHQEPSWPPAGDWRPVANDQDEFLKRLGEALKSPHVRAKIDSLLALSNEKNRPADTETAA